MSCDLDACYEAVLALAKEAGQWIREAADAEKRIETKASAADLVTETDQKVEEFVISSLKKKFPTHSFIGEESVAAGQKCNLTENPTWIIDPVDGTTNFVHRFPFVCISIALSVNKVTEIGLVYNPILDEMYTARRGQGAFCNGKKIEVSKQEDIHKSLVCTEFGSGRDAAQLDSKFRTMRRIIEKVHGIHCTGSAALDMCLVAEGRADAHYQMVILHCWDVAAGDLIVREAGGVVMDTAGGPLDLMARRVLCAGTPKLAASLVECIELIEGMERD